MRDEQTYRALGFFGTVAATAIAVPLGSAAGVHTLLGSGPSVSAPAVVAAVFVTAAATYPLYKPRSRRILDTVSATLRSLSLAVLVSATLGYFGFAYRLPRTALLVAAAVLAVGLPLWFVALQRRYLDGSGRTLVVGHDPERIGSAIRRADGPVAGYASSPQPVSTANGKRVNTDGGVGVTEYDCLGGLSRLDEILAESDVGTVVPALPRTDRAEFFGVLDTCHRHGVDVAVPDEHGESVLLCGEDSESGLAEIDLEPWDLQNRLCKRLFDICFAAGALALASPVICLAALAVRLDSPGPVLYRQERTALFGDTFHVYKFRTMRPESEAATPGEDAERITRVGRVLRRTHLDELPQLWAILRGQMSVVGPRAAWTAEEELLLEQTRTWQKRWFVKPGLTGLAQINDASSETPEEKLRCDLTYIREQSFRFDAKILIRQLWQVALDAVSMVTRRSR